MKGTFLADCSTVGWPFAVEEMTSAGHIFGHLAPLRWDYWAGSDCLVGMPSVHECNSGPVCCQE